MGQRAICRSHRDIPVEPKRVSVPAAAGHFGLERSHRCRDLAVSLVGSSRAVRSFAGEVFVEDVELTGEVVAVDVPHWIATDGDLCEEVAGSCVVPLAETETGAQKTPLAASPMKRPDAARSA